MDYTILEMCEKKSNFVACRKCRENLNKGISPYLGYSFGKYKDTPVLIECDCHIKWRKERELENKVLEAGISDNYTFDDYRGTLSVNSVKKLKYLAENPDKFVNKSMIYIFGPNSTQKSSMSRTVAREFIKKDYSVVFTTMNNIIAGISPDFKETEEEKGKKNAFIRKCMECDFLFIDESFDREKAQVYTSGYQIPYIDNFLRNRFEINGKSIIFISNVPKDKICENGYSVSIQKMVTRNVETTTLEFKDEYLASLPKVEGMFGNCIVDLS